MIDANELNKMSTEELRELNSVAVQILKLRNREKQSSIASTFSVGDRVSFYSNRGLMSGVVVKINQKTIMVNTNFGVFKCSPSLLTKQSQV